MARGRPKKKKPGDQPAVEQSSFETWRKRGTFTQIVLGYPESYSEAQPKTERWAFVKPPC